MAPSSRCSVRVHPLEKPFGVLIEFHWPGCIKQVWMEPRIPIEWTFGAIDSTKLQQYQDRLQSINSSAISCILMTQSSLQQIGCVPLLLQCNQVSDSVSQNRIPIVVHHQAKNVAPRLLQEYCETCLSNEQSIKFLGTINLATCFEHVDGILYNERIQVDHDVFVTAIASQHNLKYHHSTNYYLEVHGMTFLYTNNQCYDISNQIQSLPSPSVMVSHLSNEHSESYTEQLHHLFGMIHQHRQRNNNCVIWLPVSSGENFFEIYHALAQICAAMRWNVPFFSTNDTLVHASSNLSDHSGYQIQPFNWKWLNAFRESPTSGIIFSAPGLVSHGASCELLKSLVVLPECLVVLSQYTDESKTMNHKLLSGKSQDELKVLLGQTPTCKICSFTFHERTTKRDLARMVNSVQPTHLGLINDGGKQELQNTGIFLGQSCSWLRNLQLLQSKVVAEFYVDRLLPVEFDQSLLVSKHDQARCFEASSLDEISIKQDHMFNGIMLADPEQRHLFVVSETAASTFLGITSHILRFSSVCKTVLPPNGTSKRRKTAALSFLLSGGGSASNTEDEINIPVPFDVVRRAILQSFKKYVPSAKVLVTSEHAMVINDSIDLSVEEDWRLKVTWNYQDKELASRLISLGNVILRQEYEKLDYE